MSEFKVGDLVKVVDNGRQYSTYETWVKTIAPEQFSNFKRGKLVENEVTGIIVAAAPHLQSGANLYLIKVEDSVFIMGENGLKLDLATIAPKVSYVLSNLPLGEPLELECCYNAMTEQEVIKEFESGCKSDFIERGDKYMVYKLVPYKILEIGTKETLV